MPLAYGFIPNTLAGDGDPQDILIICSVPLTPLAVVRVKPIAVLNMIDGG